MNVIIPLILLALFQTNSCNLKCQEPLSFILDNIYLGDDRAVKNLDLLNKYNITSVINFDPSKKENYFSDVIDYFNINLPNSPSKYKLFPVIDSGYNYIKKHRKNKILIHSDSQNERGITIIIYYLIKDKGYNYEGALEYIHKRRKCIKEISTYAEQMREKEDEIIKELFENMNYIDL